MRSWDIISKSDHVIDQLYRKKPVLKEVESHGVFIDLIRAIIGQQVSSQAAKYVFDRFMTNMEPLGLSPALLSQMEVDELKNLGLSRQKANYIINIGDHFKIEKRKDEDFLSMSDDEVSKELTSIKGVGEWTAQMILMFSLNRPDIFPTGDLAIQLTMKELYKFDAKGKDLVHKMTRIAENWRPYRTDVCRLLWIYRGEQKAKKTK